LEEVANMRSVPNWIYYLHANYWIFSPPLAILFNFLKSKTDLDFPNFFEFKINFESEEVPMDKVVPLFKSFRTIFYLKKLSSGISFLDWSKLERI
jgi:hypothetical protein